jgi:hypothetical protein
MSQQFRRSVEHLIIRRNEASRVPSILKYGVSQNY